jgi:hypothetical protein
MNQRKPNRPEATFREEAFAGDPIARVMAAIDKLATALTDCRAQQYACAQEFYAAAQRLEKDDDALDRFMNHGRWSELAIDKPRAASPLACILRLALQGDKGKESKWNAVLKHFRDKKIPAEEVAEKLEEGRGFIPIYKSIPRKARPSKGAEIAETDAVTDPSGKSSFNFENTRGFGEPEHDKVAWRAQAIPARNHGLAAEKKTGAAIEDRPSHKLVDMSKHLILEATYAQIVDARSYEPRSKVIVKATVGTPDAQGFIPMMVDSIEPDDEATF